MSTIFPLTANVCVFCFAFLIDVRAYLDIDHHKRMS